MNLLKIAQMTDDDARAYLEGIRWPNGPRCPHCGTRYPHRITGKATSRHPARKGLYKCAGPKCRRQFTVTVGTIFERSHLPLGKWIAAFHLMTSSKKGISAHQLHRMLEVTYKTAWFMAHRIRHAMSEQPLKRKLQGIVEADETFIGGKPRRRNATRGAEGRPVAGAIRRPKAPVLGLVERDGKARALALETVTPAEIKGHMQTHVSRLARIMTDEAGHYRKIGDHFDGHQAVKHSMGEYARGHVSTNQVEGFFSMVKRQYHGTHHHYSRQHMQKYLDEMAFRWNGRKMNDSDRRDEAVRSAEGKRLTYRDPGK